jgi:hypothetical protein
MSTRILKDIITGYMRFQGMEARHRDAELRLSPEAWREIKIDNDPDMRGLVNYYKPEVFGMSVLIDESLENCDWEIREKPQSGVSSRK